MPGKVIGIDLGTTHCRVAVMEGERSVVIPNAFGERFTPNIVAITESGEWVVGREAERLYRKAPEAGVSGITRFLGLTQPSSAFQEEAEASAVQFGAVEDNKETISLRGRILTLDEILIELFRKLKWTAECYLGEEVADSVIALATPWVPAAKSQIKKCAEVAGLQVLRIYTSAVMAAVGHDRGVLGERQILICDFGGGFCNAAVVSTGEGVFEVKSVEALRHVCGKTIDRALAAHLAIEFRKDKGIGLEGNRTAQERLRIAAEEAKIILSSLEETDVHVPLLAQDSSGRLRSLTTCLSTEKMEEIS